MDDYKTIARYENVIKRRTADSWNPDQEKILKIWAEKASGWAWLHDKSCRYYNSLTNRYTYPSILLSTLSSGLGFSIAGNLENTSQNMNRYMSYVIGLMNIVSAALASFQKFIRSTEKAEMHLHMTKIFSSFCRKIVLELALQPGDRRDCIEFCKNCRDEYDKLVTDSPEIPSEIITKFRQTFADTIHIPEVANGLVHFNTYEKTTDGSSHKAFIGMRAFFSWRSKLPSSRIPPLDTNNMSDDENTIEINTQI
jgi:hypothetical protein